MQEVRETKVMTTTKEKIRLEKEAKAIRLQKEDKALML